MIILIYYYYYTIISLFYHNPQKHRFIIVHTNYTSIHNGIRIEQYL